MEGRPHKGALFKKMDTKKFPNEMKNESMIRDQRSLINIPRYETPVYLTSESEATFEMKPLHLTVVIDVSCDFLNSDVTLFFSLSLFSGE